MVKILLWHYLHMYMLIQIVYTNCVKLILHHHFQRLEPYSITKALDMEGIICILIRYSQVHNHVPRNWFCVKEARLWLSI